MANRHANKRIIYWPPFWNKVYRELTQPRRRRQQEPHKFAYLTMKNSIFARFARAVLILTFRRRSRSFYNVK